MSDLTSLIERVEAATGSDGKLNAEIACAIFFPHLRPARPDDHKEFQYGTPPGNSAIWCPTGFLQAQNYTGSIDAALTLLPEGMDWRLERNTDIRMGFGAAVFEPGTPGKYPGIRLYSGATAPLALLAAILRARQTEARG